MSEKLPRLRVPSAERQTGLAPLPLGRFATGDLTMEPVSDAFTDSHPQRGRRKRLAVITGSFQIFPDRRWASLRLGTNARLPPKWHVCLSVCSLRCARRLPRATVRKVASLASAPLRKGKLAWRLAPLSLCRFATRVKRWSQSRTPSLILTPSGDVVNAWQS